MENGIQREINNNNNVWKLKSHVHQKKLPSKIDVLNNLVKILHKFKVNKKEERENYQ